MARAWVAKASTCAARCSSRTRAARRARTACSSASRSAASRRRVMRARPSPSPDGKASWKSPVDAGSAAYSAPAFYSSFGGPIDDHGLVARAPARQPRQDPDAAARRQGARREANYSHRGRRGQQAGSDRLGDHRHQQFAHPGLGRCQQQVLRVLLLPELAAGCLRRRTPAPRRGADQGAGRRGAGAGQVAGQDARGRRRLPQRAGVRRRRQGLPRRSDRGRRERPHQRRRPGEVGEGAEGCAGDRRPRQDAAAGPVGLPHARRQ